MTKPADHPHGDEASVANVTQSDLDKAQKDGEAYFTSMGNRSLTDKIMGNSVEYSKKRVASSESIKDKAQIAASVSGVILPHADAGNAGASLGRSIDHALGVNVPQSGTQAWKHLKAAGWNLASVIPGVGEVKKTKKVLEGSADLYKSMSPIYNTANLLDKTKKTSTKVKDAIGGVGNWGYWMDSETGTLPSLYNTMFGGDTDADE